MRALRSSLLVLALALAGSALAQDEYEARFLQAWSLVAERYWDLSSVPVDWREVGERYRPRALAADGDQEFYSVLESMYEELGDNHSVFVPPGRVDEIRSSYGALPCLPVLGQAGSTPSDRFEQSLLDEVGYLRVPDLATTGVSARLRVAVRELESAGATGLVLDLRGNPGGRLVEMMQAAGVFTGGFLWRVVTNWSLPIPYPALGGSETELPLAILVDAGVHSAAEGLAGALQQQGRAVVIGETTAGNVEAVLPFCLRDGSQAWIATGVLAPIGAPTWEGRGVVPDIAIAPEEALEAALLHFRQ